MTGCVFNKDKPLKAAMEEVTRQSADACGKPAARQGWRACRGHQVGKYWKSRAAKAEKLNLAAA